jgi:DNA-binding NtrC family response regulator
MNPFPSVSASAPSSAASYHSAVHEFKRHLIEQTLRSVHGNRTHAARALGLQRTYLLRLIRDLDVAAPPPPSRRRGPGAAPAA